MPKALPTLDKWMQNVVETGLACESCGAEFTAAHGKPVLCATCGRETVLQATKLVRLARPEVERVLALLGKSLAIHEERTRVAHANEARKRRTIKQARQERAE